MAKKGKATGKPPKAVEGELEPGDETYERLQSAREHLTAALDDVRQFLEHDAPHLAQGAVSKFDAAITHGVSSTADTMIKALEELKQRVRKPPED